MLDVKRECMSLTYINKPNFFILGAGKSGTTSLYYYLKQHPDIFMTEVKEPTFFCQGFQVVANPIEYFELYDSVSTEKVIGEASHAYLSNPTTAKMLNGLFPDSKFVVILRNPVDRAYSLYHHMRRDGLEHINTFEAALDAEELRYRSEKFKKNCPQYFYNYLYFRSGLYGEQLQNYFSKFPKQQFHIIKFEEFITDPASHFNSIFKFLDVSPNFSGQFEPHNAGKMTARFPKAQYYVRTGKTRMRRVKKFSWSLLKRVNMTKIPPMKIATREMLTARYQADLALLSALTGVSFLDKQSESKCVQSDPNIAVAQAV